MIWLRDTLLLLCIHKGCEKTISSPKNGAAAVFPIRCSTSFSVEEKKWDLNLGWSRTKEVTERVIVWFYSSRRQRMDFGVKIGIGLVRQNTDKGELNKNQTNTQLIPITETDVSDA